MPQNKKDEKIVEKELSYELVGVFFDVQKRLGRFCRERQYADVLEATLKERKIAFQREAPIVLEGVRSNFVDFVIEGRILVDLKAKPFIEKDDYYQTKRYLEAANKQLGLIVNFRQRYLQPKRVLNSKFSKHSNVFVVSNRGGQSLVEALVALSVITVAFFAMIALLSSSLFYGRTVSDDYLATYLAAEGVEIVKNIVDANALAVGRGVNISWNSGLADGDYEAQYNWFSLQPFQSRPVLFDPLTRLYGYDGTEQTGFTRRIRLANIDLNGDLAPDMIRINSIVSWTAGGGAQKTVNLEDELYDWRPR